MAELPAKESSLFNEAPHLATGLTRVPRTAQARLLMHDPEVDSPFMEVLCQTLPDETARLAYLNHLAWQART
ncbi:MAG TPA: hypothetical protein PLU26_03310 [Candidatus Competibacter sp.]|nr:hypothetical protein [Candidatus Competibacter sp.]